MRSVVIAGMMTGLVAGVGLALAPTRAPAPRAPAEAESRTSAPASGGRASGAAEPLAAEAPPASGEPSAGGGKRVFYQWTDERGSVRFARSLDEVPRAWRDRAGQIEVDAGAFRPAAAPAPSARTASPRSGAARPQPPRSSHDVTVYTAPWCGWCRKTLAFLDRRGVEYVNKDIEADAGYAAELEEKSGGHSIPFVEIDGTQIRGYSPGEMAALLE